jgi:hypothetical protein
MKSKYYVRKFFYITVFPSLIVLPITILGKDFFDIIGGQTCSTTYPDDPTFCFYYLGERLIIFSVIYMILSYPLFLIYKLFRWSIS